MGGYNLEHGGNGYAMSNEDGERILDMAQSFKLLVIVGFRKKEERLLTYKSGATGHQVDYKQVMNCKVTAAGLSLHFLKCEFLKKKKKK